MNDAHRDHTHRDDLPPGATRVGGLTTGGRVVVVMLFGGVGLGLGFAIPYLVRWATELPWVPLQGPLELLGSFDDDWLVWGRPLIGLALGLALSLFAIRASAVLTLSDDRIEIREGDDITVIEREKVDGVRRRGSKILILSSTGRELFHGEVEGTKAEIQQAFSAHHYPWESG